MLMSTYSVGTYTETSSHANLSGDIRSQSSQLAGPLWTDRGIKSELSVRELISTSKREEKKGRRGMISQTFSQTPGKR